MEQRFGNTLRMTVNEKKFIETALLSDLRVDGRSPFDYRRITIKFGSEDGSSEVQLGQTHVIGFVTAQLVQPYRDRPNEGTLSIYTEFSPMADPSFEAGRPGESAVELGRIIDRGLRESRAVDTESLCVSAGKIVWSIRIDLHILDNGGNLVDAANIAALAALSTFRRPECTIGGGEDGQEVIVHPPEVREPLPLIIHHLPIAVTFAFLGKENTMVIDPTHYEEAVMGGRMTATLNTSGDVCAIQKAGGEGVLPSVIMQCLRIASVKAADITNKIKNANWATFEPPKTTVKRMLLQEDRPKASPNRSFLLIDKPHLTTTPRSLEGSAVARTNNSNITTIYSYPSKSKGVADTPRKQSSENTSTMFSQWGNKLPDAVSQSGTRDFNLTIERSTLSHLMPPSISTRLPTTQTLLGTDKDRPIFTESSSLETGKSLKFPLSSSVAAAFGSAPSHPIKATTITTATTKVHTGEIITSSPSTSSLSVSSSLSHPMFGLSSR